MQVSFSRIRSDNVWLFCAAQISWYFEIGRTYLEKPRYESVDKLIEPTPEQLAKMFLEIDEDDSGEVDLHEVHEALSHLWPCMDVQGFQRAFEAADLDASGHIDMEEFKHLLTFISASLRAVVLAAAGALALSTTICEVPDPGVAAPQFGSTRSGTQ